MNANTRKLAHLRAVALISLCFASAYADASAPFAKRVDLRIPMRDGVRLSADTWLPVSDGSHPVILMRTPYFTNSAFGRYSDMAQFFVEHGYIFMVQDVRGTGESEGEFCSFHQEAEDGYDTVEWIAEQSWSNGKVGMMGASYSGTVQWLAAKEGPPHVTCLV